MTRRNFSSLSALTVLSAALTGGCLDHPIKQVEYCKVENPNVHVELEANRDVDILFVVDNSGSMAEEQARLARNFGAFITRLDAMEANYRIGVTTTDAGNPRCSAAATTPEGGDLVLRSCLDRLGEGAFQFGDFDASFACTDVCELAGDQLAVLPTTTDREATAAPRPWIQKIDGETNLPAGVSMAQAFACFGPQGVDGCGYEQPLESMYLALKKALIETEQNFGFQRDEALLSIVFVTDENDCSYNPAHQDIFMTNKQFWSVPEDPAPTSAVCFNAGVACEGGRCEPEDYSSDGAPDAAPADAVLWPISRYTDLLEQIRRDKQTWNPSGDVLVSLIAGVPEGYEKGGVEIPYAPAAEGSDQQIDFGIAPGCVNTSDGSNSTAVPPVRERVVAEAFSGGDLNLYSICQDSYVAALEGIARRIEKAIPPACANVLVADADLETEALEPHCKIEQLADGVTTEVPWCVEQGGVMVAPDGATICAVALTDPEGRTPSALDDMTVVKDDETGETRVPCSTPESNAEFKLLRFGPRVRGAQYNATCLSQAAQLCGLDEEVAG